MSYKNYVKAMKLAKKCDDYCTGDGVTDSVIGKAENLLDIKLSRQVKEYLKTYGYMEFFGVELYGIVKTDFSSEVIEGCMVEWTRNQRENSNLNSKWIPIRFEDDGCMAMLNFESLNEDNEPCVILAEETDSGYEMTEKIADDLGDYILGLVNDQLEDQ